MTDNTELKEELREKLKALYHKGVNSVLIDWEFDDPKPLTDEIINDFTTYTNASLQEVIDEIDNGLDDIKGCAEKRYYPYQEDNRRLEHISSAVNEIHQILTNKKINNNE